jgi:hypothetical protein
VAKGGVLDGIQHGRPRNRNLIFFVVLCDVATVLATFDLEFAHGSYNDLNSNEFTVRIRQNAIWCDVQKPTT